MSVTLNQKVVNPVGNGENTDQGTKRNAPSNVTSGEVCIVPGVCNPVATKMSTDGGPQNACQTPLPMRPIPS